MLAYCNNYRDFKCKLSWDSSGSATVIPGGGTGGFTYLWIPSGGTGAIAQNLSAGTYSVIVSDSNECTATSTASISQPAAFVIATSITNATCVQSDGSALVNVSGGTGQYSYFWNSIPPQTTQTAAGLAAGVYNCTISDSIGCTTTSTIIIGNTTTLSATSSPANIYVTVKITEQLQYYTLAESGLSPFMDTFRSNNINTEV
ncbi:MAG: SprB repeat-containing protein [Bacteroidetes bacterium]|nr:SprB repeat-containing protein [Bacteroidota bacterium]